MRKRHPLLDKRVAVERSFFTSLSYLESLYGLSGVDTSSYHYPYNIFMAYQHAAGRLEKAHKLELMIASDEETGEIGLATIDRYCTGTQLYYIPVYPLFTLLKQKEQKALTGLLLSIMAYLHQVAGVPYFTDESCYLGYCYRTMEAWDEQNSYEWDKEDYAVRQRQYREVYGGGRAIHRRIMAACQLKQFSGRVLRFKAATPAEQRLRDVGMKLLQLYTAYPTATLSDYMLDDQQWEDREDRMRLDQYLSFFWGDDDLLDMSLQEFINEDLSQHMEVDEPVAYQFFNKPQEKVCHVHDFCRALFSSVAELCHVLYRIA